MGKEKIRRQRHVGEWKENMHKRERRSGAWKPRESERNLRRKVPAQKCDVISCKWCQLISRSVALLCLAGTFPGDAKCVLGEGTEIRKSGETKLKICWRLCLKCS